MKTLKKALSGILAAAMAVASLTAASFAATEAYDKNGDFAVNGAFPETGKILDWQFYAQPSGMSNQWVDLSSKGITIENYKWADNTFKDNPNFNFSIDGKTVDGADIWKGASTIKTGILQLDSYVYVPELINPDSEAYTQLFSIWGINYDKTWYKEQGSLYSVIMNDNQSPYIGFTVDGHHSAATNVDAEYAYAVPMDTKRWYKLSAVINYDEKTLDYFIDDEYVCSHRNFAGNSHYYEMGALYYSKSGNPSTNNTHVYVTGVKATRVSPVLTAKAEITGENTINVMFDSGVSGDSITNNTFAVTSSQGAAYNINSVTLKDSKNAVITIDGTIGAQEAVTVICNENIRAKNTAKLLKGNAIIALPASKASVLNMDFDNISLPTDYESSWQFTDFYCEYQPQPDYTANYASDFINAKKYNDLNNDHYYLKYSFRQFSLRSSVSGKGKALDFHRDSDIRRANAWGPNRTMGLIIPFDNNQSVESGKISIEFDAGKIGVVNSDSYTIGLHDANNEITKYDLENAWSNSTALFGFGDYWETETIIYAPRGRSNSYSYYYGQSNPADKVLWPENWANVKNNNEVRHYKVELDLDTKTYDIYQNDELIGSALSLPETENAPKYDAFVVGSGLDKRDAMTDATSSFYLDNVKITKLTNLDLELKAIENADGTDFGGTVADKKVVFSFNKDIKSLNASVGNTEIVPVISGGKVTIPFDAVKFTGNATLTLSDIKAADGSVMESFSVLVTAPKAEMKGFFSESPAGYVLNLDDGGYEGDYTVFAASYNSAGKMISVYAAEGNSTGIYPLPEDFDPAGSMKGFVFDKNLIPLINTIVEFE